MKRILTAEEFSELMTRDLSLEAAALAVSSPKMSRAELQNLCTHIANTLPLKVAYHAKRNPPYPWGCSISPDTDDNFLKNKFAMNVLYLHSVHTSTRNSLSKE